MIKTGNVQPVPERSGPRAESRGRRAVITLIWVISLGSSVLSAQIHKDSSLITAWAGSCTVERGYINISDTTKTDQGSNRASVGDPANGAGPADEVSLVWAMEAQLLIH